jgi:uncharacterized membrane protein
VYEGEGLTIGHLFAGFRTHLDTLVLIAVVFALLMAGIVLVLFLIFGAGLMAAMMNPEMARQSIGLFLGALLVASLLFLPVMMAYGFAPALAAIGERGVLDSLKQSFTGCLRNVMPFILYSLVFIVLAVLASLPFMLGWIVLAPVAVASMYAAYRDIYYED